MKQKKNAFFSFLTPLIQNENNSVLNQRQFIQKQYQIFKSKDTLSIENTVLLNTYVSDYRCRNTDLSNAKTYDELLIRVDIIPQELALCKLLRIVMGKQLFCKGGEQSFRTVVF